MANWFQKAAKAFLPTNNSNQEGLTSNMDLQDLDEQRLLTIVGNLANVNSDDVRYLWDRNNNYYGRRPSELELLDIAYAGNPYVNTIVNKIAKRTSCFPLKLVDKTDPEREITLPPKLQKLLKSPNPKYSLQELFYKIDASYLVTGNGFFAGVNDTVGFPFTKLFVPVSRKVDIYDNDMGVPLSYHIDYYESSITYQPENVLHLLVPDITQDWERGFSPLTAAREVYLANNALWSNERKLHENQGANGFITPSGGSDFAVSTKDQKNDQRAFDRIMGNSKFGKNIILKGSYDYKQMGLDPAKLKSVETKIDHLRTLAELYEIPSVVVGDTTNSTYNNMMTAKLMAMHQAYLPLADYRLKEFSKWLIQDNYGVENVELIVDREQIAELNEVDKTFSDKVVQEVNTGIITTEEARELIYPDLESNNNLEENES